MLCIWSSSTRWNTFMAVIQFHTPSIELPMLAFAHIHNNFNKPILATSLQMLTRSGNAFKKAITFFCRWYRFNAEARPKLLLDINNSKNKWHRRCFIVNTAVLRKQSQNATRGNLYLLKNNNSKLDWYVQHRECSIVNNNWVLGKVWMIPSGKTTPPATGTAKW